DEHYLRPTEEHYREAIEGPAQKAAQQRAATTENDPQVPQPQNARPCVSTEKSDDLRDSTAGRDPPKWAVLDLNQ
ncbi:MAG: hypothetical protein R6U98_01205, partial [Pirellulaceae bacterium]